MVLNATWNFVTSDRMVKHLGYEPHQLQDKVAEIDLEVADAHHELEALELDERQQEAYDKLLEEREQLAALRVAMELPSGHVVTFKQMTHVLCFLLIALVIYFSISGMCRCLASMKIWAVQHFGNQPIQRPVELGHYAQGLRRLERRTSTRV